MLYYSSIIILHLFIFHKRILFLRNQWIYNEYYKFAPFIVVFLILYLLIKLHKIKSEPVFYTKKDVTLSALYICAPIIMLSYLGIIISLELDVFYSFYLFFIALIIGYSFFFIRKKYRNIFIKFYSFFIITIPLPFLITTTFENIINEEDIQKLEIYLRFAKIIIFFMGIFILLLFFILVLRRKLYNRKLKFKKILVNKYSDIINNYLYENFTLEQAAKELGKIKYPILLMTIDNILDLVKGDFEDKIILLCKNTSVYDFLLNESKSKKWWKKVKSIYHLGRLKYTEGLKDGFYTKMLKDKNNDVRAVTVVALTLINNIFSVDYIINALFDKSKIVQEKAQEGLIKYGKKSYKNIIIKLEKEKNEDNILMLLELIALIKDDNFINEIIDYLESPNNKIVAKTLKIAGALEYPVDNSLIIKHLKSNDTFLIKTIMQNIYNIANESIIDNIKDFIKHSDWDIRYFTATGLYKLGQKGRETLIDIQKNTDDKYAADMANMVMDEQNLINPQNITYKPTDKDKKYRENQQTKHITKSTYKKTY